MTYGETAPFPREKKHVTSRNRRGDLFDRWDEWRRRRTLLFFLGL